jgi:ureidoglycolate lyase
MIIKSEPLTREKFLPFGDLIDCSAAQKIITINQGRAQRFHDLGRIDIPTNAPPLVNIFRSKPLTLPFQIRSLERHPLSSQFFFPLDSEPYLVVVAGIGDFDCDHHIQAFLASPKQGVNYKPGVWHHSLMALNRVCEFLVLDREDLAHNCDEVQLAKSVFVHLNS